MIQQVFFMQRTGALGSREELGESQAVDKLLDLRDLPSLTLLSNSEHEHVFILPRHPGSAGSSGVRLMTVKSTRRDLGHEMIR